MRISQENYVRFNLLCLPGFICGGNGDGYDVYEDVDGDGTVDVDGGYAYVEGHGYGSGFFYGGFNRNIDGNIDPYGDGDDNAYNFVDGNGHSHDDLNYFDGYVDIYDTNFL